MGSSDSSPDNCGWRIIQIIPNSPCSDKNLIEYFDYIIGINGFRLDTSSETFWDSIRNHKNKKIILTVFNYKTRFKRDIEVIPNDTWGGQGLLGLVIALSDFTLADEQCIRVIKVHPNSPAYNSGLTEKNDYILGTPIEAFTDMNKFTNSIHQFQEKKLPLFVYNSLYATLRIIFIIPTHQWDGDGLLGCEIGSGLLHNIPSLTEQQDDIQFLGFSPSPNPINIKNIKSNLNENINNSNDDNNNNIDNNNKNITNRNNYEPTNNENQETMFSYPNKYNDDELLRTISQESIQSQQSVESSNVELGNPTLSAQSLPSIREENTSNDNNNNIKKDGNLNDYLQNNTESHEGKNDKLIQQPSQNPNYSDRTAFFG